MTSLDKFLSYRKECPLCESYLTLETFKGPDINLNYRFEDNDIVIQRSISGWQLSKNKFEFTVEIRLDTSTNEFLIDFLDKDGRPKNIISFSQMNKYLEYVRNKKDTVTFQNACRSCGKYGYRSNSFFFNHTTAVIHPLIVTNEFGILRDMREELTMLYYIHNDFINNTTNLEVSKVSKEDVEGGRSTNVDIQIWQMFGVKNSKKINIPLVNVDLSNKSKSIEKLDTLMLFS